MIDRGVDDEGIAARYAAVRARVRAAARAVGRADEAVSLIAVSKMQPVAAVMAAYDAGARDFGENTVQELVEKANALASSGRRPRWHFIGRLQRNKVNLVLPHVYRIHSVDRLELGVAIAKRIEEQPAAILLQVNIGREAQKGGVDPGQALDLARQLSEHSALSLYGLMAVPPLQVDPVPYFEALAASLAVMAKQNWGGKMQELSMGMSHDFEAAIRCGATWVRVGTAIFGERNARREDKP